MNFLVEDLHTELICHWHCLHHSGHRDNIAWRYNITKICCQFNIDCSWNSTAFAE